MIHLYSYQSKLKFGLQIYENIDKEFCERKIHQLTQTTGENWSPNITKVVGFSKYSHSNKLVDLSILYDLGNWYGLSLENVINHRIKNNTPFKEAEVLDFLAQILDVLINTSSVTY